MRMDCIAVEVNVSEGQSKQFTSAKTRDRGNCENRSVRFSGFLQDSPNVRLFEVHRLCRLSLTPY
jgi:hypothetical protein